MPRKPPGMPWQSFIDAQIDRARDEGEFDDLPGEGKPDPNLSEVRDPLWWGKNLARREGVSVMPPALEIRKAAEHFRESLAGIASEQQVRGILAALNAKIAQLNSHAASGPPTTLAPLDEHEVLEQWREARSQGD